MAEGVNARRLAVIAALCALVVIPFAAARLAAPDEADAQLPQLPELPAAQLPDLPNLSTNGLLGALGDLLCPVVSAVDDAVAQVPVVSDVTGLLRTLVCGLELLEFRFHTVYEGPNGPIEKTFDATVGLPTQMNVDNQGGPDIVGTITPQGLLTGLSLQINRTGGSAPLPVSVEALIKDPTGGGLGADTIAVGYDQRDDRAPQRFKATLGLGSLISPAGDPTLDVDFTQQSPGDETNLIAGFFSGSPTDRVDPTEGRIEFENSPTDLGLSLTLADPLVASITTDVTGPVNASLTETEGADERAFNARIEDLPSEMTLTVGQADPRVAYSGSDGAGNPHTIDRLEIGASSTQPLFDRARHLSARIDGLASGTELNFDQATSSVALTTTQAISQVELFAGSDPEQAGDLPPAGEQGARIVDREGAPFTIGARVNDLKNLSASLEAPYTLHTETAGGPFSIAALLDDTEANIDINDLPTVLDLSADIEGGEISYAGSSPIDSIGIGVIGDEPLLLDANQVSLLLEGVPTDFTVNLAPSLTDFSFTSQGSIDKIEAKAKSPSAADDSNVLGANDAGAVLRDVGSDTFVFARVFDLEELGVGLDPIELRAKMEAGRKFIGDLILEQDGAPNLDLDATVENLPSDLTLGVGDDGTGGTRVSYSANSAIDTISLNATGLELLPGADPFRGLLTSIPQAFTLDLPASGPVASLDVPSGQLGQVRVAAGALGLPGAAGDDNLTYRDLPGQFGISGRLSAIRNFAIGLDPVALDLGLSNNAAQRKPIDLDARIKEGADPTQVITARLDKPSSQTSLDLVTAEGQPTELSYEGTSPINSITLNADNLAGLPQLDGVLETIPTSLDVCFDPGIGCQRNNPHNIGRQQTSIISLDIDDNGTATSPLRLVSADIVTEPGGDPIVIRDIRLRELGVDIGLHPDFDFPDNTFAHVFMDTDNRDFSIDRVEYDTIERFAIGTPGNPARAQDRLLNVNGTNTVFGIPTGVNTQTRGSLACGGQRRLEIEVIGLTLNLLDLPILGDVVPLCSS